MRLLYDAVLPRSLSNEAPAGVELLRWDGGAVSDQELVSAAAERRCRGLILLGGGSLEQPDLRKAAEESGVALIAAATESPFEAKQRVLKHLGKIRKAAADHDCLLVLAVEVRPRSDSSV
ncbi:MAG: hypothetical protein OXE79_08530 [Acidimicrobiaceae bacterium]|nr:hypothetical protein [Acidimicrobiaceae bacterium]MCY4279843.1 hypothetical protein [Acidimicrobiaceae bacterium]MCY4294144.1 hypothetical protein [Acidimicrobiaceae bacterium]